MSRRPQPCSSAGRSAGEPRPWHRSWHLGREDGAGRRIGPRRGRSQRPARHRPSASLLERAGPSELVERGRGDPGRARCPHPQLMAGVAAVGLSGQMLGVACIDAAGEPIRPAILWNDGRATAECAEVEMAVGDFAGLVGCRAMVGFPAPKLRWLAKHEPAVLDRTRHILLPKDYVRLRLTGEVASDRADASATLLMDTRAGTWSQELLAVCGVTEAQMPTLVESAETVGHILPRLARRWGLSAVVPVVGGAGDNMCGGVGAGIVAAGMASISLGTSGVYFVANDRFVPARGQGMHTHLHALPGLFAQNACVLSAGAALAWVAALVGGSDIPQLVAEVEAAAIPIGETLVFTPISPASARRMTIQSFAPPFPALASPRRACIWCNPSLRASPWRCAICHHAFLAAGASVSEVVLVGGGANSRLWPRLLASAIDMPLMKSAVAAVGPALGAARLARQGIGGPLIAKSTDDGERILPIPTIAQALEAKRRRYAAHLNIR